ncbi:hypothetical protein BCV72DRAFT_115399 [Rhizopus microsporus var. microsporus]|uniref:Phospholipid/glycerol acyltransferase domain-containing protein n=1 Tax=Rhizopus microsporus var. microsporus TaxID=86635 RepID=A0A1X0RGY8_RHIZD|nr:hypothetical protein BCV72DRAFT_115399 [Rhizopus microsporus var. microsporus]
MSAWLALFSQSIPVIEPDQGQRPVDIVPVDYVSKCIIYSVPQLAHKKESLATIYHIPPLPTSITWYQAYTAIQDYWSRPNNALLLDQKLPTAKNYFSANKTLTKARFLIRYYFRPNAKNTVTTSKKLDIDQSKWLELASNIRNNLAKQHTHQWQYDTTHFQQLPLTKYIDKYCGLDEYNYFMQSCYGTKIYSLHGGVHVRAPTLDDTSTCALYSIDKSKTMAPDEENQYYPEVIDEPFPSIVYTEEEMKQRMKDMMDITIKSLHHLAQSLKEEKVWKPVWIEYINDTLEDWCTMIETLDTNSKNNLAKRWRLTGNTEMTKVAVLNDPNVIEAIQQVSKRSGMPAEKVMEEAIRSLNRIQERTQLPYAWFAASFLEKLLKNMFSCIRINKDDLAKIQKAIGETEKKIIYVPVSRTVLDPIIVWFIAIRYNLPIPVLLLDEALAILGPFSDILRLAGAVFIKRDPHGRSTLTTAVTSAYLRHLLRERGAVTMVLEKVRSRSGLYQKPFDDGMLSMIQDKENALFIPVNMTYEEVPDLANLVKHGLHHPKAGKNVSSLSRSRSYRMSTPTKVSRPSDSRAQRVRSRSLGHGQLHLLKLEEDRDKTHVHHYGKILIGFGNPISSDTGDLADKIQKEQKKSAVLSPVSLVAAILLYSRVQGNVIDLETVKKYLGYLYEFIRAQGIPIDWQDFEDSENIIFYSIRLLEKGSDAITIEEKNNHTAIRISIESDSILQLAYYANQLQEIFVLDSIFAVVYLSLGSKGNNDTNVTFFERFEFLATLFQYYFSANWNIKEEYNHLTEKYKQNDKDDINNNQYFNLLASFVYPTIDSFWVTLCALSALLDDVKALPYSLVPLLTQWIGMHLISGRRTIYSEVLSAEYSQNTLKSLFQFGLLDTQSAKMLLSPDAQMLMQVLGFSTNENLIVRQEQHDIRQVCKQIEQVRIKLEEGPSSSYVFEKCQNQIKSLIKTKDNTCFSKKQGATLVDAKEEAMIQLGYTLIQSMEPSLSHVSP